MKHYLLQIWGLIWIAYFYFSWNISQIDGIFAKMEFELLLLELHFVLLT